MNRTVDATFLAAEQARDPDSFRSEYLALFEGSGAQFLDFERFEASDRGELPPEAGHGWVVGLDPAFSSDPFGIAVVGRSHERAGGLVLAQVRAWRPRRADSFEAKRAVEDELMDQVIAACHRFGASAVTDQHAARAVVDLLTTAGIYVQVHPMSAASKTAAFGELRARLYDGTLDIYADPALMAELRRLRSKFSAGTAAVVNPRVGGSHGDMAQALALAVQAHAQLGPVAGRLPGGTGQTMLGNIMERAL